MPLDDLFISWHNLAVVWDVEGTDGFAEWFANLTDDEQVSVGRIVDHMRELRVQHQGRPYRVLYAFDPRRAAILLLGGDKTGDNRWYEVHVPKADTLYDEHLRQLEQEG